jgi:autotransporter-associated beta strand protein
MQFMFTTLSGLGTLVKTGTNNLILGMDGFATNVSFSAGSKIDVMQGLLRNEYGEGNWTNNQAAMYVANGATVDLWDSPEGITVDALTGSGTVQHTSYGGTEPLTVGVAGGSGTFGGLITDAVALGSGPQVLYLVKSGTGNQTLTGASTYTGSTSITGGTLQLGNGQAGQDGSIAGTNMVSNNGSLAYDLFGNQAAGYSINGNGSLTKLGPGHLTLSGTNTYTGGTTVAGGELIVTNSEALADGSSLTVGNASLFPASAAPSFIAPAAVAPVPEPGTLAILGVGAAIALIRIRRSRRRKVQLPESGARASA